MQIHSVWNIIDNKAALKAKEAFSKGDEVVEFRNVFEIEPVEFPPYPWCELASDFPNNSPFYKTIFEGAQEFLNRFPNCCDLHKKLNNVTWFRKEKYESLPYRVARSVAYVDYCTNIACVQKNWFELITDYLDILSRSFGSLPAEYGPPVGLHIFTESLIRYFTLMSPLIQEQDLKIITYIQDEFINHKRKPGTFNLKMLFKIYKDWLEFFPFRLPYFANLKAHFEKSRPFLVGNVRENMYDGMVKGSLASIEEFPRILVNISMQLLSSIDTTVMVKSFSQDEIFKVQIETEKELHRFCQNTLLKKYFDGVTIDFSFIKSWLDNERIFFSRIVSLESNNNNPKMIENQVPHQYPNIDKYLEEVQSLQVLVVERYFNQGGYIKEVDPKVMTNLPFKKAHYLCIDQYDQSESNYEAEITRLQEKALNEAIMLTEFQVNNVINRVQNLIDKYELFWPKYFQICELNREGRLNMADIELLMYPFFIVDKHQHGQITTEFVDLLHDAVMFKQGSLFAFKGDLLKVTGKINDQEKMDKTNKKGPTNDLENQKLEEIFNPEFREHFQKFLSVLYLCDNPPIDDEGLVFPKPLKGIFIVWYKALHLKNIIVREARSDDKIASLLNIQFPGLNIEASLVRKENKRANEFKALFETEISAIKAGINNQ